MTLRPLIRDLVRGPLRSPLDRRGGSGRRVAVLGSSDTPVSAGATVNNTTTWFPMQSIPVPSTLTAWECYATAAGTVKLKVATKSASGSGWDITDLQTLTCSAIGLNRFAVSASIPANSLIGFHTPAAGGATISFGNSGLYVIRGGYIAGTGDLSGANQALTAAASYLNEIQARAFVTFDRTSVPGTYLINEVFAGTTTPAYAVNNATTPWSFAVANQTTCAATGLANFLDFFPTSNGDNMTLFVEFLFQAAGDRFCIYRKPILNDASVDDGTIVEADLTGNSLKVYQTWGGSTVLPAVRTTFPLVNLTLATAVRYRLELTYSAKVVTARITRVSDNVNDVVQVDNAASDLSGFAHGRPGFANIAGSAIVKELKFLAGVPDPKVLVIGDSIAGDTGTVTAAQQFSQLVINRVAGSGWYSSDGGTTADNGVRRLRHELRLCRPDYVVILFGANDAANSTDAGEFIGYMQEIFDLCMSQGAAPVVLMPLPANADPTRNARLDTMRAQVLAKSWPVVRTDIAMSTGDGSTADAAKYADSLHPNATGMIAIDARIAADRPDMFV